MKKLFIAIAVFFMAFTTFAQEQNQTQSLNTEQTSENNDNQISNDFKFVVTSNAVLKKEIVHIGNFKDLICEVVIFTDMSNARKEGFITFKGKNKDGYLAQSDIYSCYDALKLVKNELQPAIRTFYIYESSTGFSFVSELENKTYWYAIRVSPKSVLQEFRKKDINALMDILAKGNATIEEMLK